MVRLISVDRHFLLGDQTVKALDDVDLLVRAGEYISVMGPSGSGKSTLLNILGLLDQPSRGEYVLDGVSTTGLKDKARAAYRQSEIGFVFQSYHLIPRMTARANIELPLMLAGVPPRERQARIKPVMERLGIADRAEHLPKQLSGGQRQRVAIGRAIMMKPKLLLADEPTGNLDTASGAEVVSLLEELNKEGITLIVVTHDLDLGTRARRQIKMVDGRIAADTSQASERDTRAGEGHDTR
ncbi:macrolide ABC transporter ATP-binding protein [Hahella sp. CCB-MM4]|nr:macrolide ABC transporter ATP-binding protein [Hahella sp. CCB-MM4]